jgi:MscS family membrane protein
MNYEPILNYQLWNIPVTHVGIAVTIFLFSLLCRTLISQLLLKPLRKLARRTKTKNDDRLIDVMEEPLKFSVVLAGIYFAIKWLPFQGIDTLLELFVRSFFTFVIFWILYRMVEAFSHLFHLFSSKFGKELHSDIQNFLTKTMRVIIIALGAMAILQEWGINVSAFVASLGLGGLAFALAAKDTVANLFGSLVIFSDRPFKVGDWVETPVVEGYIEEIGIRSTKVRTFAQALVSVPNATMANTPITNWSRMGKRRIKTRIGLTYSTTAEQMQAIVDEIQEMLKNHPDIHQETILVNFDEFESSALSIFLYCFTKTVLWSEYLHVRQDVNFKIMRIVAKHQAAFAFPSQSLYVESLPK